MTSSISNQNLLRVIKASPGIAMPRLAELLPDVSRRTILHWVKGLIEEGLVTSEGRNRWTTYRAVDSTGDGVDAKFSPRSQNANKIQAYVEQPRAARKPVGYDFDFLNAYRPNETFYLTQDERFYLRSLAAGAPVNEPAGTYAKRIYHRLLIDLSWNSSRLEGNTYSLLDTKRLLEWGEAVPQVDPRQAQMIWNHKAAINFLIESADGIGFTKQTFQQLHAYLADNLMEDPAAVGRLRQIEVMIGGSAYLPLAMPQLIDEHFSQLLATAAAIRDPFEQSLFIMVQLPYLQPFEDVNKRVSRLGANIPFIKGNLPPLTLLDVEKDDYTKAILGVYELRRVDMFKELFIWAYERSAQQYRAVRQTLGDPDLFIMKYRDSLRTVVTEVVRGRLGRRAAFLHIKSWAEAHIPPVDVETFRQKTERELLSLHEGNFARYPIKPSEFTAWQSGWSQIELHLP